MKIMSELKAIMNKVIKWVNNDYSAQFTAIKEKKYDPRKFPFLLNIEPSNPSGVKIPIFVYKPSDYKDKISIYSVLSFDKKQIKHFDALKPETKKKVILELSEGLIWMNLVVSFSPDSTQNIRHIGFQEIIYFDGLSKDRIMNAITRTLTAYGYVVTVLQKYNLHA
jgi:hypothetical protein